MKIVIAGAGEIGFHLAQLLSKQEQDIILIDTNPDVLAFSQSYLDIIAIQGDSTSLETLQVANMNDTDLFIAVTSREETNIVSSILARKMGASRTIARISKEEYLRENVQENFRSIGIEYLFYPSQIAAQEICRLINETSLNDIHEFEQGKLSLTGILLDGDSPLINKSLAETANLNPKMEFMAIAIQRNKQTIIPRGNTVFLEDDHVFFIASKKGIEKIIQLSGKKRRKARNIMILGGGPIGRMTTRMLEKSCKIKLIEQNKEKCFALSEDFRNALVINGNGTNLDFLLEEELEKMDAFIALTQNSETNIISSLMARNHGVHKTIALVDNADYVHLSQQVRVDTVINKKLISASKIFTYIRKGNVRGLAGLPGMDAEVIEFEVDAGSRVVKSKIRNIDFPNNALIGGVIRGQKQYIPNGDFRIIENDKVIVFTMPDAINDIEKLF